MLYAALIPSVLLRLGSFQRTVLILSLSRKSSPPLYLPPSPPRLIAAASPKPPLPAAWPLMSATFHPVPLAGMYICTCHETRTPLSAAALGFSIAFSFWGLTTVKKKTSRTTSTLPPPAPAPLVDTRRCTLPLTSKIGFLFLFVCLFVCRKAEAAPGDGDADDLSPRAAGLQAFGANLAAARTMLLSRGRGSGSGGGGDVSGGTPPSGRESGGAGSGGGGGAKKASAGAGKTGGRR